MPGFQHVQKHQKQGRVQHVKTERKEQQVSQEAARPSSEFFQLITRACKKVQNLL